MKLLNEEIARSLENELTKALKAKLLEQGHKATGKGLKSIETVVRSSGVDLSIQILGEDYLAFQETGRKAGSMPPIDALKSWVKRKGIASDMKEVNRIAWAIGTNMKKIGMHSRNGRIDLSKRHFISSTLEDKATIINDKLFQMFEKNFDLLVTQFIGKFQSQYQIKV